MKNRRFTIVAFLLVAVIAMSIRFAVVSHELQVTLASGAMTAAGQQATFKVTVKNSNTQHRAQLSNPEIVYAPISSGSSETSDSHLTVTTSGIATGTILGINDGAAGGDDVTT